MSQPLVILGTGGGVHDVLDIVQAVNQVAPTWEVVGFLDDALPAGSSRLGYEVLGPLQTADRLYGHAFVNAIGSDRSIARLPDILAGTRLTTDRFATLVHPGASVSPRARLGRGVTVNYGVSVGGGVVVGNNVTLCPRTIVGHDSTIEDFTILAPGAVVSGHVHIERCCYIGAGAVVRQNLRIGEGALVGMGAVVIREVASKTVVVGNPARPRSIPSARTVERKRTDLGRPMPLRLSPEGAP